MRLERSAGVKMMQGLTDYTKAIKFYFKGNRNPLMGFYLFRKKSLWFQYRAWFKERSFRRLFE